MMRLLDRPVMEYALKLLKKHGVREAAVTLGYLPDAIVDFFGDGGDWGLSLRYYTERTPLGTAGGVRQAADFLDETFCVLSGDGVTDLDLSAALAFHREHGALATMVLTRVPDPMEYGLVIPAADGRVRAFVEKPGPGEAISDTVNTGIYILEPEIFAHIPEGRALRLRRRTVPPARPRRAGPSTAACWRATGATSAMWALTCARMPSFWRES